MGKFRESIRISRAAIVAIAAAVATVTTGVVIELKLEKIPPGHVGVSVRKCGESGVAKAPIPTGYYWRTLFCEEVVVYPTSMQALVLTRNPHEGTGGPDGKEEDQSIMVTSSEGLGIGVDVALNFRLDSQKVPAIYETWRTDVEHISHLYLRQTIREAVQNVFAEYTAQQLYSDKKEEARSKIEKFLVGRLASLGFVPAQFTLNRIEPPRAVIDAINAKVEMVQQAQRAEAEVQKRQAEAAQAVAVAEGQAKANRILAEGQAAATRVQAEAQAQANQQLAASVTPALVDYLRAIKWDGKLPSVTGGAVPMLNVRP